MGDSQIYRAVVIAFLNQSASSTQPKVWHSYSQQDQEQLQNPFTGACALNCFLRSRIKILDPRPQETVQCATAFLLRSSSRRILWNLYRDPNGCLGLVSCPRSESRIIVGVHCLLSWTIVIFFSLLPFCHHLFIIYTSIFPRVEGRHRKRMEVAFNELIIFGVKTYLWEYCP